jgi:hypothetical protein
VFPARPDLRVSDAQRDAVAEFLTQHYAEGRLTDTELSERVDAAYAARHESQLGVLIHDLPPLDVAQPPARRRGRRLRRSAVALAALVGTVLVLSALPTELSILFVALTVPMLVALSLVLVPVALTALAVGWIVRTLGRPRYHRGHRPVW